MATEKKASTSAPLARPCELHYWMMKVDDLVEPRPEQIALPRLPTLTSPRRRPQRSKGIGLQLYLPSSWWAR